METRKTLEGAAAEPCEFPLWCEQGKPDGTPYLCRTCLARAALDGEPSGLELAARRLADAYDTASVPIEADLDDAIHDVIGALHALPAPAPPSDATHRCKVCGALW